MEPIDLSLSRIRDTDEQRIEELVTGAAHRYPDLGVSWGAAGGRWAVSVDLFVERAPEDWIRMQFPSSGTDDGAHRHLLPLLEGPGFEAFLRSAQDLLHHPALFRYGGPDGMRIIPVAVVREHTAADETPRPHRHRR